MAPFCLERAASCSVDRLWSTITNFADYGQWLPLTRMTQDEGEPGVGWSFAGWSGIGPLGFLDPMTIDRWQPPDSGGVGEFSVTKRGRVLAGWAQVVVRPGVDPQHSHLEWTEEIRLRPHRLGVRLAPVLDPVNRAMFARAVDAMVAAAELVATAERRSGAGAAQQ